MSLLAALAGSAVRALVLVLMAWPVCRALERTFRGLASRFRPVFLTVLLVPFCFPELLVAYAFRDLALTHPTTAELLCAGLLLVRLIPVGTAALIVAPPPALDAAALHCRRLVAKSFPTRGQVWELGRCYWRGPLRRIGPALALMGLLAFQEFELAALLQASSWTDWFITAERLGLDRTQQLRSAALPLLLQAPLLGLILAWLGQSRANRLIPTDSVEPAVPSTRGVATGLVLLTLLVLAGCLIPLLMIGSRTLDGLGLLLRQRTQQLGLLREMSGAALAAGCATALAWFASARLRGLALVLLVPGFLGSLLVSLAGVSLFQVPGLRLLYDTPLPWVLVLSVWLIPRATILRLWIHNLRPSEALHAADLLSAGDPVRQRQRARLRWHLADQATILALGLLWFWAYCDLPSAYLLAPTGMASGLVRLYNFMHFGRSAALSAEGVVFFGTPLAGLVVLIALHRRWR